MVPLGGFVRMLDEREAPVPASLRNMAFNTKPIGSRALIVLAGPLASLLLAVVLYAGELVGFGAGQACARHPVAGSLAAQAGLRTGEWVSATQVADETPTETRSFEQLRWALTRAALGNSDILFFCIRT